MNLPRRVLLLAPSLAWGGLGRTVSELSCCLPRSVEQTLVLLEPRVVYPYQGDLRVLKSPWPEQVPQLRLFSLVAQFRRILSEVQPAVVLAFYRGRAINHLASLTLPQCPYRSIQAFLGVPTALSRYQPKASAPRRWLESVVLRRSQSILACTQGVKEDLVARYRLDPGRVHVVHSPVAVQQVVAKSQESVEHPWFLDSIPLIISSGRFVREKNQADLVRALALLKKDFPCRLVLLGEGELAMELQSLATAQGVLDDILFLGFQDNPFKYLAKATVFAFPSHTEGQGLALIEALAVGCPVVSYDCPVGPREILAPEGRGERNDSGAEEGQYGWLVPAGDVRCLARALRTLIKDAATRARLSRGGKQRAWEYDVAKVAPQYLELLS